MLRVRIELDYGATIIARTYSRLSSCRYPGFGMTPIPADRVLDWCRYKRYRPEVTEHMMDVFAAIDSIYIRRARSDAPASTPPKKGAPRGPQAPAADEEAPPPRKAHKKARTR